MDEWRLIIERIERLERWRSGVETRENSPRLDSIESRLAALEGAWTDYSNVSTIVGWSSFTTKEIYYARTGNLVFVAFNLSGTSNSALASFTLPYAPASPGFRNACLVGDNGSLLAASGFVRASPADGTKAVIGKDWTTQGNFTTSGTKTASGQFWYEAA